MWKELWTLIKILSTNSVLLYFILTFLTQVFFWWLAYLKGATSYTWLTIKLFEALALFCFYHDITKKKKKMVSAWSDNCIIYILRKFRKETVLLCIPMKRLDMRIIFIRIFINKCSDFMSYMSCQYLL